MTQVDTARPLRQGQRKPDSIVSTSTGRAVTDAAAWTLCAVAALFGAWALHVGWSHGILDVHAWRQSHTAISVQEMVRGGPFWRYRTPIFGPPWQWPLELPIYQWIVAVVARAFGIAIEPAGRAVSVAFFVGALSALWVALDLFGISRRHRPIVLALVWASPLYIFWSRAFMIESTALCFGMVYVAAVHRATRPSGGAPSTMACVVAAAAGALAGATKVTTFAPFLAGAALIIAVRWRSTAWSRRAQILTFAWLFAIPLAATAGWLLFADSQKVSNPLAAELVWSGERDQRFGSLVDRVRLRSWSVVASNALLGRTRHAVIGSVWVFAAALAALVLLRRRLAPAIACAVLYALPIAVFMKLFVVHVYYSYENGFLLALIVGCAIVTCLEGPRVARLAGVALFAAALTAMATNYLEGYFVDQDAGDMAPMTLGLLTKQLTRADDVMLIYGLEYSPAVPYASDRRALMDAKNRSVADPAISGPLAQLARDGARIGAIVVCGSARGEAIVQANIAALRFPEHARHTEAYCDLYVKP